MRWEGRRESDNVEDRRGGGDGGFDGGRVGAGGGGFPIRLGGGGIGTIVVVLIVSWVLGINPMTLLGRSMESMPVGPGASQFERQNAPRPASRDQMTRFVSTVLADTEDRFDRLLPSQLNRPYEAPVLVLFSGSTRSGCGFASQESGPFYCPADRKVYIDLAFYEELKTRFRAPGDFAQAYVIAHEVGHHIQNLLGILPRVNAERGRLPQDRANELSVRVELQADCFAGVWAHHAAREKNYIEAGDIEEALNAASRIGDDAIQKTIRGYATPDTFTHGTSEQRVRWFRTGFQAGDMRNCDTFRAQRL
jgi:hypothetical protein